jgi:hypothetical protein
MALSVRASLGTPTLLRKVQWLSIQLSNHSPYMTPGNPQVHQTTRLLPILRGRGRPSIAGTCQTSPSPELLEHTTSLTGLHHRQDCKARPWNAWSRIIPRCCYFNSREQEKVQCSVETQPANPTLI